MVASALSYPCIALKCIPAEQVAAAETDPLLHLGAMELVSRHGELLWLYLQDWCCTTPLGATTLLALRWAG